MGWITGTGLEWDGSLERGWNEIDYRNGTGMGWITGTELIT
jgi:hypothetical protein